MNKIAFTLSYSLFLFLLSSATHASGFGLKDVFKNLHVNNTASGSYHDAASGWYSGGSSVIRTKNTSLQPFSVNAPSLKTGCSGIDAFAGSFSMISGEELVTIVYNVLSEAPVYGFHLGMKTYAPQAEQVFKDLRNLQMELTQFGIGHCKVTQSAFAAVLPQNTAMYETVCNEMAAGSANDLGLQRKQCRDYSAQKEAVARAQEIDPELLMDNYNLFIKAASAAGIPKEMQPALMSMVGTIVVRDGVMIPYPALASDEQSWSVHINGGQGAAQYGCQDSKCLNITLRNDIYITKEDSYSGKARTKLDKIKDKIIAQTTELTQEEIGFLDSLGSNFPVFDHITLEAVSGISILDSSSEVIARYMLLNHLTQVTSDIRKSVISLKQKQINDQHLSQYQDSLSRLLKYANTKWFKVMADSDRINMRAEKIEKHLIARERG